jgi:Pyruvate/2-oxoacid:ferredoxin oxidoreductase gamma subunit
MGLEKYPDLSVVLDAIDEISDRFFPIDANDLAEKAGNRLAASSVLIGAITGLKDFPISREAVERALLRRVPAQYADANQKAFTIGYEEMKSRFPGSRDQSEETQ